MKKKIDVTALGEILIDFTFAGKSSAGKNIFEENPGGAPANCACAVSKLGGKSAFIASYSSPSTRAERGIFHSAEILALTHSFQSLI